MSGKTARLNQSDNIQYVKIIAALMEYKNIRKLQCFRKDIGKRWYDDNGILNISLMDFLLDKELI